jgi:hypothetical protein
LELCGACVADVCGNGPGSRLLTFEGPLSLSHPFLSRKKA